MYSAAPVTLVIYFWLLIHCTITIVASSLFHDPDCLTFPFPRIPCPNDQWWNPGHNR